MKIRLFFSALVLLLGASVSRCKKEDPPPPTALEDAIGRHEGGHCHYAVRSGPQLAIVSDSTFDNGVVTVTRIDDDYASVDGYGLLYPVSLFMPVGSTDTLFHISGSSYSSGFALSINTSSRTIKTGAGFHPPNLQSESEESGVWNF